MADHLSPSSFLLLRRARHLAVICRENRAFPQTESDTEISLSLWKSALQSDIMEKVGNATLHLENRCLFRPPRALPSNWRVWICVKCKLGRSHQSRLVGLSATCCHCRFFRAAEGATGGIIRESAFAGKTEAAYQQPSLAA